MLSIRRVPSIVKTSTILLLLTIYLFNNQKYFLRSVEKENTNESLELARYINKYFPDRNLYITSFPGFAFEKMYYFSPGKNANKIKTDYHDNFLKNFNPDEKYVYVIIFPKDFNEKFKRVDENGKLIKFSDNYSLFVN